MNNKVYSEKLIMIGKIKGITELLEDGFNNDIMLDLLNEISGDVEELKRIIKENEE